MCLQDSCLKQTICGDCTQARKARKNQGVGFERKFNANGVEWEEDQYPKTKFVPQREKYDPTSFKERQA